LAALDWQLPSCQLTPRQKHALESICETFFPSSEGWPSAVELGVPDALAEALEFNRGREAARSF